MEHSRLAALLVLPALCLACTAAPAPRPDVAEATADLPYKTYTLGQGEPDALLVALHYSGSTPEFWDALVKDWSTPLRVILPQGPRPHREGFTWFPVGHEQKGVAEKVADVEHMAARIADLIRDVRRAHPGIRRVAVTGFSYGGDLAWLLAARHPELVDVSVPMGTRLLGEPTAPLPTTRQVLVLQGEVDPIIDAQETSARVEALKARGVPIDVRVYPGLGHDLSPQLIADWSTFLQQALRGDSSD